MEIDDITTLNLTQYDDDNYRIDFRPYMIENPYSVFTTDQIIKCLEIFRKMHLRHLVVIHPDQGDVRGIITR